jgi:hypothetical protein
LIQSVMRRVPARSFLRAVRRMTRGGSLPIREPEQLATEEPRRSLHARMEAAEAQDPRLLRCHLEAEFDQPLGQGMGGLV